MKIALRTLRLVLVGLVLAAFTASLVQGKPEYAKKEGKACTTCHTKMGSKELNEVGKCYEKQKSLEACKAPQKK